MEQQPHDSDAKPQGGRRGWAHWIAWLGAALAVLSNAVGVLDFAANNRLMLSLVTGTLAVVVGGFWLVRLFMAGESGRMDTAMFALNLAMVLVGSGLVGGAVAERWPGRGEEVRPPTQASVTNAPGISGQAETTNEPTTPRQPGAITIEFLFPAFGNTFADGQNANGKISGMPTGTEIWLLVRRQDDSVLIAQGPCPTDGATWICVKVRLPGPPGAYVLTAVAAPANVVAALRNARELRAIPSGVLASTEVIVYR